MKLIWIFIFLLKFKPAFSQTVSGKILDQKTNSPIPYATVKVLHAPKGVIASNKGEFELNIDAADSVLFSCVGYYQKILVGKEMRAEIFLEPKIRILEDVIATDKKWIQTSVLGNTNKKIKGDENWGLTRETKEEFAQKIELPDSSLVYKVKNIYIPVKKYICWGPLLLHVYAADANSEYPGEELLVKPFHISNKDVHHDKAVIDISSENLYLYHSKSFFVGISRLQDSATEKCLTTLFVSRSSDARTYIRTLYSSSYEWRTFGHVKDKNNIIYEVRTFFSVEVDEMK